MRIDSIRLFRLPAHDVPNELGEPLESVVVVAASGQIRGYGEVTLPRSPRGCAEWAGGAFACLRDWLAPALVAQSIDRGEQLQQLLEAFEGNAYAKSALDIAWWTLRAAERGEPLHQLLGAASNRVPLAATVGPCESVEAMLREIGEAFARGFQRVTLKFRPNLGVQAIRAARELFPTQSLAIDCDGMTTLGDREMFYRLEDFFLHAIEQPLAADDLVGHAMLQESLRTPIVLDQSITSPARAEQAIDLGSCRRVRIDLARVGGITPALAIRKICQEANMSCEMGGEGCQGTAATATAAMAALCGGDLPMSVRRTGDHSAPEIVLSEVPPSGLAIDENDLNDAAIEKAEIR
jgi:O-succinylbenzoate synthase